MKYIHVLSLACVLSFALTFSAIASVAIEENSVSEASSTGTEQPSVLIEDITAPDVAEAATGTDIETKASDEETFPMQGSDDITDDTTEGNINITPEAKSDVTSTDTNLQGIALVLLLLGVGFIVVVGLRKRNGV